MLRDGLGDEGLTIAQASHAAYEFGIKYPGVKTNGYLYVLRASKKDLSHWDLMLAFERTPYILFRETDLDNEPTALCCSINPNRLSKLKKY